VFPAARWRLTTLPAALSAAVTICLVALGGPGGGMPAAARAAVPGSGEPAVNRRLAMPAGHLGRSEAEPPYICVHGAFGASFSGAQGQPGYGGSFVFLPPAASGFLDLLYDWNTGVVLQYDWLGLAGSGHVRSCDLVFRHYFSGRQRGRAQVQPFAGAGLGVSSVTVSTGDLANLPNDWSWVLEGGQEWRTVRGRLLFVKAQVRLLNVDGHDFSRWSLLAGIGLPFPW
jgi:hypothetical protein